MATKTILCPYCFEEFNNNEAWYQCESEERDQNGEYRCERVHREEYDRYWKSEGLYLRNVWPQKSGLGARLFGAKFDARKCPECGYKSRRFVCPHCFNWLPTDMIENGAEIISVIGSPSSGKTNYIVSLIHQLRKYGYKMDLQVAPTQIYRDNHKDESTQNMFKKLDNQLFRDNQVLMKTAVNKAEIPWIFHLSQQDTGKHIYLVFYDTAGEKFNEAQSLKSNARYFEKSVANIVLLDVLSVDDIKRVLKKKGYDALAGKPSAPLENIQFTLTNLDDKAVFSKPTAFVFSKFDAVIDNAEDMGIATDEFCVGDDKLDSGYVKSGKVDFRKINAISETIEGALEEWGEGDFCKFAHRWGAKTKKGIEPNNPDNNYKFFGVSAFGSMPDDTDSLGEVKPYRVMDPLVWILHKLGQFKIPGK